jgi:aspartate/methionine/tyrosine aminotransferase
MINTLKSGAKYSQISKIGEKVRNLERQSGEEYLYLNQGVNAVVPIDLSEVSKLIDYNSKDIQVYAPQKGRIKLRTAVSKLYFQGSTSIDNILIDNGGMSGLDLVIQTVEFSKMILPSYFWGSYANILKIRNKEFDFYDSFTDLGKQAEDLKGCAVLICDPNNPLGNKVSDKDLISLIRKLNALGVIVVIDSPYRGVFYSNDNFYAQIGQIENVIIVESFSKSIGLSGQRIGFIHTNNAELMSELEIRLMYASNGVNGFAQLLVELLFTTKEGAKAISDFKNKTTKDILLNINYLKSNNFLAEEFYVNSHPKGIFVVVNKSAEELLENKIAAISLDFFTHKYKEKAGGFSRICVSVPHDKLKSFFQNIEK